MVQATDVRSDGRPRRRAGAGARAGSWAVLAAAIGLLAAPALAQDAKSDGKSDTKPDAGSEPKAETRPSGAAPALRLELNRLEPAGDNCRTYLLVDNSRGPALKSLKTDLFAFDTEGVAQKRLAVELGPIQEHKTVVRLFDFPAISCPKIGRVLLNDVLACEGGEASRESCLERIETSSKTSAEFTR